jgi:uncharacterized protein
VHRRARRLIRTLALRPHPEGGHYAEVFRSPHHVRRADSELGGERAAMTSIYFLLAAGERSRWHRVWADEVWHYYEGDPLELVWLEGEEGALRRARLGLPTAGKEPVAVIPAGCWQAARSRGEYTLVGCTVAPGFEFTDFTVLADAPEEAARVRARYPDLAYLI